VILTRHTLDHIEVRADARELLGLAVPYGQPTEIGSYIESLARGAFAGIDAGSVPLTAAHPRDGAELPIGVSAELRESEAGLHGTGESAAPSWVMRSSRWPAMACHWVVHRVHPGAGPVEP
jgi:phage head maturation protease